MGVEPGPLRLMGQVVALRALDQVAVRFRRGTFLLEARLLEVLPG